MRQRLTGSWWPWAILPALAILAYLPALGVGFLSDDYGFLFRAETRDLRGYWGPAIFLPSQGAGVAFYRPFGMIATWQLGWQAWGLNPFPYHLLGLFLHAATALVLGLYVADLTGKRNVGILAGALFAIFPVHTEAVGWLSAQWDIWAALFGITSLWLFNRWWQSANSDYPQHISQQPRTRMLYGLALLAYAFSIFSKESALTWIVVPGAATLIMGWGRENNAALLRKLTLALLPFCAVLFVYLAIRFLTLGGFGGYSVASSAYSQFFWDAIVRNVGILLSPISPAVLGPVTQQVVGAISSCVLLVGLVLYARNSMRAVAFCGAWLVLALVPVLNLEVHQADLQGNRTLYLPSLAYCALAAILVQPILNSVRARLKAVSVVGAGIAVTIIMAVTWLQLSVWQTATRQADEVGQTLVRLIPPASSLTATTWYVQSAPDAYKGAQVMRNGLDDLYHFLSGATPPMVVYARDVEQLTLDPEQDVYAIRFAYDEATSAFRVAYLAGLTGDAPPPPPSQNSEASLLWDFRSCASSVVAAWQPTNARVECKPGSGLVVYPENSNAQLALDNLDKPIQLSNQSYLRVGVSARYTPALNRAQGEESSNFSRFFWSVAGDSPEWVEEHSRRIEIAADSDPHVYWIGVPDGDVGGMIRGLRYDPSAATEPIEVKWIEVNVIN